MELNTKEEGDSEEKEELSIIVIEEGDDDLEGTEKE